MAKVNIDGLIESTPLNDNFDDSDVELSSLKGRVSTLETDKANKTDVVIPSYLLASNIVNDTSGVSGYAVSNALLGLQQQITPLKNSDGILNGSTILGATISDALEIADARIDTHIVRIDNPHTVTASQVGAYTKTEVQTSGSATLHWDNLTNIPNLADASWKSSVASRATLPLTGNSLSDQRVVLDDGDGKQAVYICMAITGDVDAQWDKIADVDWITEEPTRVAQEAARVIAEDGRVIAEGLRVIADTTRTGNEDARISAESARVSVEDARVIAESSRVTVEGNRVIAEGNRVTSENVRLASEIIRDQFIFAGNYNSGVQYLQNNTILYEGTSYVALQDTLGNVPTNATYWQVVAIGGEAIGDMSKIVYDPTNVDGDVFDMDNMIEGTINRILTQQERDNIAASKTKADFITVTQAVDLDDMETKVNALDSAIDIIDETNTINYSTQMKVINGKPVLEYEEVL
jgi:hypothetical protein